MKSVMQMNNSIQFKQLYYLKKEIKNMASHGDKRKANT